MRAWLQVMYAYRGSPPEDGDFRRRSRDLTTFRVIDASDYQSIHVHETERHILVSNRRRRLL